MSIVNFVTELTIRVRNLDSLLESKCARTYFFLCFFFRFISNVTIGIMALRKKILTFTEIVDTFVDGVKRMAGILTIIILAWGVGSVCSQMGTAQFIVDSTTGILSPKLVPALIFVIGAVISFATGT